MSTTYKVTVEVTTTDKDTARSLLEQHGFTVKKISAPTPKAGVTPPTVGVRPDAALDRPSGLTSLEAKAYTRGYAQACMAHVKKHGLPRAEGDATLRDATVTAEWARHPAAHKKGMALLTKERELAETFAANRRTVNDWTEGTAA